MLLGVGECFENNVKLTVLSDGSLGMDGITPKTHSLLVYHLKHDSWNSVEYRNFFSILVY